jgi:hypothetical protein
MNVKSKMLKRVQHDVWGALIMPRITSVTLNLFQGLTSGGYFRPSSFSTSPRASLTNAATQDLEEMLVFKCLCLVLGGK